jgi:hypothetical protein
MRDFRQERSINADAGVSRVDFMPAFADGIR